MNKPCVVGLLTGRGNNTLKDKNILDLLGKPVLFYPANAGKQARSINRLFVSSDDPAILNAAAQYGYEAIIRPTELATPTAQHIDAIWHALSVMDERGVNPDVLVVILANNITIQSEWIDDCIQLMLDDSTLSAVVPVYMDSDHHPFRAKRLLPNGKLDVFVQSDGHISTNRQDLEPSFFLCHNFWVLNVHMLNDASKSGQPPWTFMGNDVKAYRVHGSIDIHDEFDLRVAAQWLHHTREGGKV
ncbi:MAG: CMP-N-acetylneuraminic acid synthetase [Defluviitaleaceae bacterium]|nr:CMP-N-acetylneuraminic acid synthetase [Defluviitaleaceae bacterium]MCL2239575.1 CMP-N-acetylneuraminic acid synthetase [Defluviitaleaceae bacterium]